MFKATLALCAFAACSITNAQSSVTIFSFADSGWSHGSGSVSERTGLYATIARVKNSGGATTALNGAVTAANQSSSGFDIGIKHAF